MLGLMQNFIHQFAALCQVFLCALAKIPVLKGCHEPHAHILLDPDVLQALQALLLSEQIRYSPTKERIGELSPPSLLLSYE